jgi:hypothetical protein
MYVLSSLRCVILCYSCIYKHIFFMLILIGITAELRILAMFINFTACNYVLHIPSRQSCKSFIHYRHQNLKDFSHSLLLPYYINIVLRRDKYNFDCPVTLQDLTLISAFTSRVRSSTILFLLT